MTRAIGAPEPGARKPTAPALRLLLIADAEPLAALIAALRDREHAVELCGDAPGGFAALDRAPFDAAIVSLDPRGGSGVEGGLALIARLRAAGKALPIVAMLPTVDSAAAVTALDVGADDCVTDTIATDELVARIRASARARTFDAAIGRTIRAGDIVVSPGQQRAWRGDTALTLTRYEFGVLAELASHAGGYVGRAQLLAAVWGRDMAPATNVVDNQVRNLRRKLCANGAPDPIVTRRGLGYLLEP